ncbi:Mitochodrial transcription termination factor-related [Spatholobus suberectus]|nr:Mitochodrial transcription termination factor-related [Spatholobus suberectus]
MSQTRWKEKVDTFKKWGWSDEAFLEAFMRHPHCVLASTDKINIVMSFWVNQMSWDALALVEGPKIFGLSMEKRIIPRALVVQYLLAKGLRKRSASFLTPFSVSEKVFLEKYVMCFKEDTCQILMLYKEKMSVQGKKEDGTASGSYQMVNS